MSSKVEQEAMRLGPKMINAIAKAIQEIFQGLNDFAERESKNALVREMNKWVHNKGEVDIRCSQSIDYNQLDKALNENGIPHALMLDAESGMVICITKASDREIVKAISDGLLVSQGKQAFLSPAEFTLNNINQNVVTVSNLTPVQAKLAQEYIETHQHIDGAPTATFTSQKQEDGTYSISFAKSNEKLCRAGINSALCKTAIATDDKGNIKCGISSKITVATKESELQSIEAVTTSLNQGRELYIVSAVNPNEYIHLSKDGVEHFRNDALISELKKAHSETYNVDVYGKMMSMVKPVVLTPEEFKDKEHIKETIDIKSPHFNLVGAEYNRAKNEIKVRQLIESKMALDNDLQSENISSLYNQECSFSEFFNHELVNEEHAAEERERLEKIAKELDALPTEQKTQAMEYAKLCIETVHEHSINQREEYLDFDDLKHQNIDVYIQSLNGNELETEVDERDDKSI